jgi:hypothetical protein
MLARDPPGREFALAIDILDPEASSGEIGHNREGPEASVGDRLEGDVVLFICTEQ